MDERAGGWSEAWIACLPEMPPSREVMQSQYVLLHLRCSLLHEHSGAHKCASTSQCTFLNISGSTAQSPVWLLRVQITSLFLHMYPACVAWTERWHPAPYVKQFTKASPPLKAEWQTATLTELVLFPMVPYLLWAVLYYAKVSGSHLEPQ